MKLTSKTPRKRGGSRSGFTTRPSAPGAANVDRMIELVRGPETDSPAVCLDGDDTPMSDCRAPTPAMFDGCEGSANPFSEMNCPNMVRAVANWIDATPITNDEGDELTRMIVVRVKGSPATGGKADKLTKVVTVVLQMQGQDGRSWNLIIDGHHSTFSVWMGFPFLSLKA